MTLETEFRSILAQLELLSYGATQSWNSSGKGGKPGAKLLHGGMLGRVMHEHYAHLWDDVDVYDEDRRRAIVAEARAELEAARRRVAPLVEGESNEQKRERCVRDCEGLSAGEAAEVMRETARWVIRARALLERDPSTGRERANIERMKAQGLSVRQIALLTGKSKSSVDRALRRAA